MRPKPISWFFENLPGLQLLEDRYKSIIKQNYALSGFIPLETASIEREEVLTSKSGDNEIYGVHRLNPESKDSALALRFDLTVPLARYVAQHEWELKFPFKRQQIQKVWRGERPQKGRFREFYQADVDIIGNASLPLFADVEILFTTHSALKNLDVWDFVINLNNKKFLTGFLSAIWVSEKNILETIAIIDKKDKVEKEVLQDLLAKISISESTISEIIRLIDISEDWDFESIFTHVSSYEHELLSEWLSEIRYVYDSLLRLWLTSKDIKFNPTIARGLNYYTGTVYETFLTGYQQYGSMCSGGRYENLTSHFTKNSFPWVGWSIGLTRLLSIVISEWLIQEDKQSLTRVLVTNLDQAYLPDYLGVVKTLRDAGINTELFLDSSAKMKKQLKYGNDKTIDIILVIGEDEIKNGTISLKNMKTREQSEIKQENILSEVQKALWL